MKSPADWVRFQDGEGRQYPKNR